MRYGNYSEGSYGRQGMRGTGPYSRYNGGRGSGRYRGHDMLDEMSDAYGDYMESGRYGNYGAESMEKIEIMGDALVDFVEHIKKEAKTPEERELIDRKIKEAERV